MYFILTDFVHTKAVWNNDSTYTSARNFTIEGIKDGTRLQALGVPLVAEGASAARSADCRARVPIASAGEKEIVVRSSFQGSGTEK